MFFSDFLVSLIVGIVFTVIFAFVLGRRGPWSSILAFFVVVFLATWAGGIWITPYSPTARNVQWVPFLIVGLVASLILAASVPAWYRRAGTEPAMQPERRKPPVALLTPYYWLALIVLVITIIVR